MALLKNIAPSSLTDADLVTFYQHHHRQDDLALLFLRYSDLVYGCCVKYLSDQEAAKDAVMNIYYELVEKLKNHPVENFKSWIYVVSKNFCLMQLRKNKQQPTTELSQHNMQSEDFTHLDNVLEKEQQLLRLEDCIGLLNKDQQQCVRLFYLENKCYNEITDVTGNDWNKVRSLIQNARRNLKICMEKNGDQ